MSYLHDPFPLGFAVSKRNGKLQTKKVMFAFINKKVIFEFMYAFGEALRLKNMPHIIYPRVKFKSFQARKMTIFFFFDF